MKNGLIGEILRDTMADSADRFFDSPWCDRVCWGVIILAALYFAPIVIRTFIG